MAPEADGTEHSDEHGGQSPRSDLARIGAGRSDGGHRHDHDHDHEDHRHDHHDHDHHGHDHSSHRHHGHGHVHAPASFGLAFAVGSALNIAFVIAEAVFGIIDHSLALVADAGHNLGDVLALMVAWSASVLVKRRPSPRYTYGLRSSSMLAALFNAVVLLLVTGAVTAEAVRRLFNPSPVGGVTVMAVAAVGIAVNGGTALMFASGRKGDINIRGAFQHMLADAVIAAGVVVAGGAILATGWTLIDPLASLIVSGLIVWSTWGLLKDSLNMVLHAVPPGIDPEAVRRRLEGQTGVQALHDLHIWPMSTTETALTAHLVMPEGHPGDHALAEICKSLRAEFGIGHSTLQIEVGPHVRCELESEMVV